MAESTLSVRWDELTSAAGRFLFGQRTYASLSSSESADVDEAIDRGLRMFYWPAPLPGERHVHEWSFLKPLGTLTTSAPYSTGTVVFDFTGGSNEREITLTTGTWPSWAASGDITFDGATYAVATRVSDTVITLATGDNPGADVASTTYSLTQSAYTLDDNFGGIEGPMTYRSSDNAPKAIDVVGEARIRNLRQSSLLTTGFPEMVGIRPVPVAQQTNATSSRFEAAFWPAPDAAYVLEFRFNWLIDTVDATTEYPVGSAVHAETLIAAVLAACEMQLEPNNGTSKQDAFRDRLMASVMMDRQLNAADTVGYNGDSSDRPEYMGEIGRLLVPVTYDGTQY